MPAYRSRLAERFPALRSPDFRRIWIGQIISAAGSQMQVAALNWQIYDLTGSPIALGGIGIVRVIPIILFSLIGGTVADSYDRRRLMLITQSALTVIALLLSFLSFTHQTSILSIYILTALGAAAMSFDNPARQALVPSLVPREHLPNAFAINSTGMQVATIVGPVLAGLVIGRLGAGVAYLLNATSFLAVIYALMTMRYRPLPDAEAAPRPSLEALKEGIRFVRGTPILIAAMGLDFVATFFASASALLPVFAKDILKVGPEGFGLLSSFPAMGSLLMGVSMTLLPPIKRQGLTMLWAVVAYGLATVGFGLATNFWVAALFLAGTGAADTVSTVIRQTIRQLVTPDRLRGRMVSINMIFFMGGPQLGEMEAGLLAGWTNAVVSVVTGGIACLLATAAIAAKSPFLRDYRLPEPHPKEQEDR